MPTLVKLYQLSELSHDDSKNEVVIQTNLNTEIHITVNGETTEISFLFGNEFKVINNKIYIDTKTQTK